MAGFQNTYNGGAGYMPSPQQGAGHMESPSIDGAKKKGNHAIQPVTIKQLQDAHQATTEDTFRVDGREVGQVMVVGQVRSKSSTASNIVIQLDDGTGTITVRVWMEDHDDPNSQRKQDWKEGIYMRVIGTLKSFNQSRSLSSQRILPILDFNEITHHFLSVVHTYLHQSYPAVAAGGTAGANNMNTNFNHQVGGGGYSQGGGGGYNQGGGGYNQGGGYNNAQGGGQGWGQQQHAQQYQQRPSDAYQPPHMAPITAGNNLNARIIEVLRTSPEDDYGASVDYLSRMLGEPQNTLRLALELLSNEGSLYTTSDENHYNVSAS